MGDWRGAWYLAKHEIRRNFWGNALVLIIIGYLLMFLVPMTSETVKDGFSGNMNWTLDFLMIALLPCLGLISGQMMTAYWKQDLFTKKIIYWRTMPISLRQIALGKLIQMAMMLLATHTVFFILYFAGLRMLEVDIPITGSILNALFWFSYSLVCSTLYIYLEVSYSGKMYTVFCFITTFVFLAATLLYSNLYGASLVIIILESSMNGNWWLAFIGIAIGAAAFFIGLSAMEKRLRSRAFVK